MQTAKPLVLVVHAEAEVRVILYSILDHEGHAVATCESGREALRYLAWARPGRIIADSILPDMDGMEFLKRVRSSGLEARVIFLGHSPPVRGTAKDGAPPPRVVFLCHPLSRRELLQAVRSVPVCEELQRGSSSASRVGVGVGAPS